MSSRRRGFTLVELMIAVAAFGILGLLFDQLSTHAERRAITELQRARAEVFAAALVREAATGQKLSVETRAKLEAELPQVEVRELQFLDGSTQPPDAVTFLVSWHAAGDSRDEVALTGLKKRGAR